MCARAYVSRVITFLLFAFVLAFPVGVRKVSAATPTPPPTLNYCAITPTGTSPFPTYAFPTYAFPTFDFSTRTPCPGGVCPPTATVTVTMPPTNTPSPTFTPSPTLTPTGTALPGCNNGGMTLTYSPTVGNLIQGITAQVTSSGSLQRGTTDWMVWANYSGTGATCSNCSGPWFKMSVTVTNTSGASRTLYECYEASYTVNTTGNQEAFRGTGTSSGTVLSGCRTLNTLANNASQTVTSDWTDMAVVRPANLSYTAYTKLHYSFCSNVSGVNTPTPLPTITPTGTPLPCVMGNPNEGTVDANNAGGTGFSPPTITPGSCYVVVPNIEFDIPSLVEDVDSTVPDVIGIPGLEICVQYWGMNLSLFNFNVLSAISVVVSFVCAGIMYRMFRD